MANACMVFLILLIIASSSEAIWKCEDEDYKQVDPRLTTITPPGNQEPEYRCDDQPSLKLLDSVETAIPTLHLLPTVQYGAMVYRSDYAIDYIKLHEAVTEKHGWPAEAFISAPATELSKSVLVEPPGVAVLQVLAPCRDIKNTNTYIKAYSEPLLLRFPEAGVCKPTDMYIPAVNNKSGTYEFSNNSTTTIKVNLQQKNFGMIWETIRPFYGVSVPNLQSFIGRRFNTGTPYYKSIVKTLEKKFNDYKSKQTGRYWDYTDSHGFWQTLSPEGTLSEIENLDLEVQPGTKKWFFQIVGRCDQYTIYTKVYQTRTFDLGNICINSTVGLGVVEDCDKCSNLGQCYEDTWKWQREHPTFRV